MTAEQNPGNGLPPPSDPRPLSERYYVPPDSVLMADAQRTLYESELLYTLTRSEEMEENPFTPAMKTAMMEGTVARNRMALTSQTYDIQGIVDEISLPGLAENPDIVGLTIGDPITVHEYQIENALRSDAKIVEDLAAPDIAADRKILIKRYAEARKLASEKGVTVEEVFLFQDLYFELMRRSTSPEDIMSQLKQGIKGLRKTAPSIMVNDFRTALVIENSDNETMSVERIDGLTAGFRDSRRVQKEIEEYLQVVEVFMERYSLAAIERYWGLETAALFR